MFYLLLISRGVLILYEATPQNGQTHSNNSLDLADELFSVFDHLVEVALKDLRTL